MEKPTPRPDPMYPGELNDENIAAIFHEAGDFNRRKITCSGKDVFTYAIDGLTSGGDISEYVMKPLMEQLRGQTMEELYRNALNCVVNSVAVVCEDLDSVAYMLVNGFCVVLFPGAGAIAFETKTGEKRGIAPPDLEHSVKGPKDAFVETVRTNTSLIRRHLRSPDLRLYETKVGRRSLTNVTVVWIHGLTNEKLVQRMKKRLSSIDIDGMIMPSAVEEYITGSRTTPFPLIQYTERTDKFCYGLLRGRVGLFVDGIPIGYLTPVDLGYLMDSPEDYSRDYITASCVRVLRYAAFLIGLLLPGVFIAMTMFHMDWIPQMLRSMIEESNGVTPYDSMWEVLGLLIAFELLQESGVHLPQSIGQSVSIIGGIVVGTAAVEAGLIAPMALITVSITGVCGFVLPNRDLAGAVRLCRFVIAVLASFLGVLGIVIGVTALVLHLVRLKSFGVPYLVPYEPALLRKKMWKVKRRDHKLNPLDERNQK
ncbi:MAG: spore germination protein [Oscillospiraceae bacterium]|nr:spore germination protein [Oscillospiraceae bacterium]